MRKYWLAFAAVLVASFAVLGWVGVRIYQQAPPIPARVVEAGGRELIGPGQIEAGQNVWQALGGMQVGSVWGHGSYVAPDWTADWLHREAEFQLDGWGRAEFGRPFAELGPEEKARLAARLTAQTRKNAYDSATQTLRVEGSRARAFEANAAHYADVFRNGRDAYAIPAGALDDPAKARQLAAFFFWSAWAASTERPGDTVTYTNNWPHEPLVGNVPAGETVVWTGVSILVLLAGIGAMASWHAARRGEAPVPAPPTDPLLGAAATPSQRATVKYFWVVAALILVQILLGVVTAHYGVEGGGFYGIPLATWLPYSVARTWHTQLAIFWIATAWLAAGLYLGPAVGVEPRGQRLGVNALFVALLVVVVGSMAGQWLSIKGRLGVGDAWFYLGHSGYEYIDLGRLWQIALLAGLFLWFFLVARAIWPALQRRDEQRPLLALFLISALAIAGFYGAALGYGRHTNLAIAEYWRWWVVHLWVEGFFEVFATVVIAFLFARLGLVGVRSASSAAVLSATIFLSGGVIGTLHHLYFSGTPTVVLALGSVFSALEVVPLVFVGYDAFENLRHVRGAGWVRNYRWPVYFFVAVAFWNLVGAGLFGFMINPPIALYYMQGLNTTAVHGHTALFGVYGMLGIGLMLFCLRALRPADEWRERPLRFAFWAINGGLLAMVVLSVLPVGLMQTWAAVNHGYWYARSAEFLQTPAMQTLRWLRVVGDTVFALGAVALVLFVAALGTNRPARRRGLPAAGAGDVPPEPQVALRTCVEVGLPGPVVAAQAVGMKTNLVVALATLVAGSSSAFAGCREAGPGAPADVAAEEAAALSEGESSSLSHGARWVATWGAAPLPPDSAFELPRSFENQTVRHIVYLSAGGKQVRVRLSNEFGAQPLRVGGAHVASPAEGAAIVPGTDRPLTFSGQASITIPKGAATLSDPIDLKLASRSELAVSLYVPVATGFATYHEASNQTSYISAPGDFAGATQLPVAQTTTSLYWLSAVEVKAPGRVPAVVTLDDSITSGFRSTIDADRSWPDLLSARFNPAAGPPRLGVVNQGVGCNRLLFNECGANASSRFDRDVVAVTGATHVIVALGINDIGFPGLVGRPGEVVSADEIIVGLRQLVARAHAKELTIYGATVMPIGSSTTPGFFTPENEAKRQAVNAWVRAGGAFDAIVDFDAVMRDPAQPAQLLAAYNSGDGVRPNDAGYQAMANAVDPALFY